eukprot:evm.model.scf_1722.1 EVM.evm.TU.scf_1722.1   scf_1722:29228-31818(+)
MDANPPGVPVASSGSAPRKGTTKPYDPNRFYCPFPGCNRSFAELWRLKVHYRAPPDVRGSGKERGHGAELAGCPKCGMELKPGKHHVGCFGGRGSSRQGRRKGNQPSKGDLTQLTSQLGDLLPGNDSRKKARTGMPPVLGKQPAPEAPLQQPTIQWQSMYPCAPATAVHMPTTASVVPSGPFFMDFSQFSTPIADSAAFGRPLAQVAEPVSEERNTFSSYVCGNAGETPVMATANFAYDPAFWQQLHAQHGQHPVVTHCGALAPNQKEELLQGLQEDQVVDMGSIFDVQSVFDSMHNSGLPGNTQGHLPDTVEKIGCLGAADDLTARDRGRNPWQPEHFGMRDRHASVYPGVRIGHQPSETGDLAAANDVLFTVPGAMEPMAFALSDINAHKDVSG